MEDQKSEELAFQEVSEEYQQRLAREQRSVLRRMQFHVRRLRYGYDCDDTEKDEKDEEDGDRR